MKRRPSLSWVSILMAAGLLLLPAPQVRAQGLVLSFREELSALRPEAWAMRFFAASLVSTGVSPPVLRARGAYELGLEAGSIPRLSRAQRTVGFNGTKEEDLNRTPALARPRAAVGIGAGFSLVADWVPPAAVDGAKAQAVTVALERPLLNGVRWKVGARVGAGSANVRADITCTRAEVAAGDDLIRNPFQCARPSRDVQSYHWKSAEVVIARTLTPVLTAYASASLWRMNGLFQVNALYGGILDRSRLAYTGNDWGGALGLDWSRGPWDLGAEAFYAPLDVIRDPGGRGPSRRDDFGNVRLRIGYKLR